MFKNIFEIANLIQLNNKGESKHSIQILISVHTTENLSIDFNLKIQFYAAAILLLLKDSAKCFSLIKVN